MGEYQPPSEPIDPRLIVVLDGLEAAWTAYFTNPVGTEEEMIEGLCQVLATCISGTREQISDFCLSAKQNVEDLLLAEVYVAQWGLLDSE